MFTEPLSDNGPFINFDLPVGEILPRLILDFSFAILGGALAGIMLRMGKMTAILPGNSNS